MTSLGKNILWSCLLLLAVLAVGHFAWATYNTLRIGFADINVFLYRTWEYLKSGELYLNREPLALTYEAGRSVLKFPPLYVVPYLPWINASTGINHSIYTFLFALHVGRYVLCLILCGFCFGPRHNVRWWLSLIILFSFCAPFYEALYGLTFDNLFFFFLVVALVLMKLGQRFLPLLLLGYAANAKIYPVVQLVPALLSRNRRVLLYCVLCLLLWPVISLACFGWQAHEFYFFHILPVLLQEQTLCETGNLSLAALLCAHEKVFPALKLFFVLATVLASLYALRKKSISFERESGLFSLYVCLPLLVMQNVWGNYQVILLVPVCLLLSYSFRPAASLWPGLLAVLAWLPLVASDNYPSMNMPYYAFIDGKTARFMIDDLKPFSALLLWLTFVVLMLRKDAATDATTKPQDNSLL
jgi:hypothetical protein